MRRRPRRPGERRRQRCKAGTQGHGRCLGAPQSPRQQRGHPSSGQPAHSATSNRLPRRRTSPSSPHRTRRTIKRGDSLERLVLQSAYVRVSLCMVAPRYHRPAAPDGIPRMRNALPPSPAGCPEPVATASLRPPRRHRRRRPVHQPSPQQPAAVLQPRLSAARSPTTPSRRPRGHPSPAPPRTTAPPSPGRIRPP